MARKQITKKPERERFKREIVKLIVEWGGIATDEEHGEYRMNTKAGPLSLHACLDDDYDSPCTVFGRFDFALVGSALVGASVPSGKHNFHFSPGVTCDDAIGELRRFFERVKPTTVDHFADQTSLVPVAVVSTVLEEHGINDLRGTRGRLRMTDPLYMHGNPDHKDFNQAVAWFADHCEQRLIQLWDTNPRIRQKLASESGCDVAYAFVAHWLDAYLDCPPKYRDKHPNWETKYNYESMVA